MSTCARCGREKVSRFSAAPGCSAWENTFFHEDAMEMWLLAECRAAELDNLRALLRSVTGKLEQAADILNGEGVQDSSCADAKVASCLIDEVLRVLA